MTTQTFDWAGSQTRIASGLLAQARALEILGTWATRAALAFVPAMGIQFAASWAIVTPGMLQYFHAVLWSCGFISYAMAVESETARQVVIRLAIGITVQILTGLSAALEPELGMVAAAVLSVCTAVTVFRKA